jgi:hypothetical protein
MEKSSIKKLEAPDIKYLMSMKVKIDKKIG